MNITSFVIAIRELAATVVIAILLPCMVHRAVKIFIPEPQAIIAIKKLERKDRNDQEKESLKIWEEKREFIVFLTCVTIGLAALITGCFVSITSLATGLLLGGGLTIFTGYISYWPYLSDLFIFVSMLLAFAGLSFALYKKRQ